MMSRSLLPVFGFSQIILAFTGMSLAGLYGNTNIANAATLLAGLLFASATSTFSTFVRSLNTKVSSRIVFDEVRSRNEIEDVIDAEYKEIEPQEQESPWDVLVNLDPTLALAKLRIDIERELRRIAYNNDVDLRSNGLSIGRLMDVLIKHNSLDKRLVSVIRDVLPVCNAAIHGVEISPATTIAVLETGRDVVRLLRVTAENEPNASPERTKGRAQTPS